jgi:hypothetical protein
VTLHFGQSQLGAICLCPLVFAWLIKERSVLMCGLLNAGKDRLLDSSNHQSATLALARSKQSGLIYRPLLIPGGILSSLLATACQMQ